MHDAPDTVRRCAVAFVSFALSGCMPKAQNPSSPFWMTVGNVGSAFLLGAVGCAIASFIVKKGSKKERLDRLAGLFFVVWVAILLLS